MISREKARLLRKLIERMSAELPDSDAFDAAELFPMWHDSTAYAVGDRVQYNGVLYKCLTAHESQATWTPDASPSLWVRIDDPSIEWPAWKQPQGATDAYAKGDKVSHPTSDRHWVSAVDGNVWEPGIYGWTEA